MVGALAKAPFMSPVIEVTGLRKEYRDLRGRSFAAVDDLSFVIDGPGVYGLLGPNGSGKTTTLRLLLGLVRPTAGAVRVLGADVRDLHSVAPRIGALIEGPKFSPNHSGRRNLEHLARMSRLPEASIHEALELVELGARADDLVGSYSLGMAQRLGIAAALLGNPDLIVLDEPTNGLDPAGIADIRRLMRKLANEGRTVILASHQLHEVQQACDEVIILKSGRLVAEGPVSEIVGTTGRRRFQIEVDDRDLALAVLMRAGLHALPGLERDQIVAEADPGTTGADLNRTLAHEGLFAHRISEEQLTLEAAFLNLTDTQLADNGVTPN